MPIGSNAGAIAQSQSIKNAMRAQARDEALRQKALVADQSQAELFVDDITGEVFKAYPVVLTEADFTLTANTASTETTVASKTVPNGVEYLFRAPKSNLDRNSPYLYGSLQITNTTVELTSGAVRMKVMDAAQNDLKGQPFTGAVSQVNDADSIDWNKRLFFNSSLNCKFCDDNPLESEVFVDGNILNDIVIRNVSICYFDDKRK